MQANRDSRGKAVYRERPPRRSELNARGRHGGRSLQLQTTRQLRPHPAESNQLPHSPREQAAAMLRAYNSGRHDNHADTGGNKILLLRQISIASYQYVNSGVTHETEHLAVLNAVPAAVGDCRHFVSRTDDVPPAPFPLPTPSRQPPVRRGPLENDPRKHPTGVRLPGSPTTSAPVLSYQ